MLKYLFFSISLTFSLSAISQISKSKIITNSFIVEINPDFNLSKWASSTSLNIHKIRPIFKKLNYWAVEFSGAKALHIHRLELLKNTPGIVSVQEDYITEKRVLPNDEMIADQWALTLTEVDKVWDFTTGGKTVDGQDIVVAIIDDGFDITHEDLVENIWINQQEIPDNNEDDDGNGYRDDYFGLHLPTQTDDHLEISHGTSVAGIIGAKGNNAIGMSGINWDIKLMLLSVARSTSNTGGAVSDIVEGYQYILDQREKYNNSDGAEGAFVVVSNFSSGISGAFPGEVPMWCSIYDELGRAGILNVSAVDNDNVDVEVEGDIPTLCPSDFLITATNTDINDQKIFSAAFGALSVDLGAPGEEALSTITENRYRAFNGTSSSTPHVAGVVALLYSLPCTNLNQLSHEDPMSAALIVKKAILDGVDANLDLEGITVTGGRLNAFNSLVELDKEPPILENCPEDVTITEEDSTFLWDEPSILDDCGSAQIVSNFERGGFFRLGTTEVILSVTDLLGNAANCTFNVTKEGTPENGIEFLEIKNVIYDNMTDLLSINFETGSFEVHIVEIYNMLGQRIFRELYIPISSQNNRFDIASVNYPIAAYVAQISKAGGGIRSIKKFVIAR